MGQRTATTSKKKTTAKKRTTKRKSKTTNKTVPTKASVSDFMKNVSDADKRRDCQTIMRMMRDATGKRAAMWGPSIVGFGRYEYKYESGRQGESVLTGLSPRAQNIAIYIMPGFTGYAPLLKRLGKHKIGKSCLYIKRLSDVDESVLNQLIERSVTDMKKRHKVD